MALDSSDKLREPLIATHTPASTSKPWLRLALLYVASIFAAGFCMGQSEMITLLTNAGIFRSSCGQQQFPCAEQEQDLGLAFATLNSVGVVMMLPAGLLFDRFGGRVTGTLGALSALLGYMLLSVTVYMSEFLDAELSGFLVPAFIMLADGGAALNSYSLFGIIWSFPGHTDLVIALANSSMNAAAFVPVLMTWCMGEFGVDFQTSILVITMNAGLSLVVCWLFTPTFADYRRQVLTVTGLPMPEHPSRLTESLRYGFAILRKHWLDHVEMSFLLGSGWGAIQVYQTYLTAYARTLFPDQVGLADSVTNFSTLSLGILAVILGPASGVFMDKFGIYGIVIFFIIANLVASLLCPLPSEIAQNCVSVLGNLGNILIPNVVMRIGLAYAPPNRLGVFFGLYLLVLTISVVVVWIVPTSAAIDALTGSAARDAGASKASPASLYYVPICTVGAMGLAFGLYWLNFSQAARRRRETGDVLPALPVFVGRDEEAVASMFFCATMDQAEAIVGVPKQEILRCLAHATRYPERPQQLRGVVTSEKLFDLHLDPRFKVLEEDVSGDGAWNGQRYIETILGKLSPARDVVVAPPEGDNTEVLLPLAVPEVVEVCSAAFNGSAQRQGDPSSDWILGPRFWGKHDDPVLGKLRYCVHQIQDPGLFPDLFLPVSAEFGAGACRRSAALNCEMELLHERLVDRRPHWYVQVAAVRPDAQGRGLSSKLLRFVTRMADAEGVDCYLETSGARNIEVYRRVGFEVVKALTIDVDDAELEPGHGRSPPIGLALMMRKPVVVGRRA